MGTFVELIEKAPALAGCQNTKQKSWMLLAAYRAEIAGEEAFSRSEFDKKNPSNRCEPAICLLRGDPNAFNGAIDQIERLFHIVEYTHYIEQHGESGYNDLRDLEVEAAMSEEERYPEIAAVMTVKQALASIWNP